MPFLENALRALGRGYSVFPVLCYWNEKEGKREKKPLVQAWQKFIHNPPTRELLEEWAAKPFISKFASIGVITGDGFFVIDFDAKQPIDPLQLQEKFEWYAPENFPAWVKTGGGGLHVYVKGKATNATNIFKEDKTTSIVVDIRGDGGFVVGPGSVVWSRDPSIDALEEPTAMATYDGDLVLKKELPEAPEALTRARSSEGLSKFEGGRLVPKGQGERHAAALALAMSMVNKLQDGGKESVDTLWQAFKNVLITRLEGTNPEEEEYRRIFDTAVEKRRKEKGVYWSEFKPVVQSTIAEVQTQRELRLWDFTVLRAVRVNEILKFSLQFPDGSLASMQMEMKDYYNQMRFREAFTFGTNKFLDKIKAKAFDEFIASVKIETLENTGASNQDMVEEALLACISRLRDSENEDELKESVRARGYGKMQGKLRFRMTKFKNEYDVKGIKAAVIIQVLNNLPGCVMVGRGVYEYAYESF